MINHDGRDDMDWAHITSRYGPLRRLIPDPADDAPALPWHIDSCGVSARVHLDSGNPRLVCIEVVDNGYTPDEARQIAAAILRGVREAEQP